MAKKLRPKVINLGRHGGLMRMDRTRRVAVRIEFRPVSFVMRVPADLPRGAVRTAAFEQWVELEGPRVRKMTVKG